MTTDKIREAFEAIDARFRSGNHIPVEKAVVPAAEWHALSAALSTVPALPEREADLGEFKERLAFYLDALRDSKNHDGLAFELAYCRVTLGKALRDINDLLNAAPMNGSKP